ncbi:MAG: hypothetical protein EOP48_15750 [Sphingobacteriales bacterium]|nr:MAG: hypothetical protein EOP48_15750 [Sphingobacteriales bacterium]
MNIFKVLVYLAIYYVGFELLIFYSFVLRAWYKLGYVPYYDNPDPQDLLFDRHYAIVGYTYEPLPYSLGILLIYALICLIKRENVLKINKWHFVIFGFLMFILIMTAFSPLFEWFVD